MSAPRALVATAFYAAVMLVAGPLQAEKAPQTPQLPQAPQTDIIWGVNGHPLASYPGVSIATQLDAVRDLGMTSYRVDIGSKEHIPVLQYLVREARKRGITVLPVVTPGFDLAKASPEVLRKKAYGLAFALVSSFKGQIPVWELGNELENFAIIQPCEIQDDGTQYNCSWGPAGGVGPLEYFGPRWAKVSAVLKGLTEGAHAADPSVRRAVGTAGWGHIGAFERMKADGINWEISVWHMYGDDPEWGFKHLARYGRPIWLTEFNHLGGSKDGKEAQAEGLKRTISLLGDLQETYRVEAAHIYELLDEPYWEGYESYMGLIEMKKDARGQWVLGARKPAYDAVKAHLALGATITAPPHDLTIKHGCELKPGAKAKSVEAEAVVAYAFCLVLGREPDSAGLIGWKARMAGGMPVEELLVGLLHSEEFSGLYDLPRLTSAETVRLIYLLLVGAQPDEAQLKRSVADLEAKKPVADLQRALIATEAFHTRHPTLFAKGTPIVQATVRDGPRPTTPVVRRKCDTDIMRRPLDLERGQVVYGYCLVLGRWPDGQGLDAWRDEMRNGLSLEHFLLGLLDSNEFAAKYQVEALDDTDFVTLAYRLLLGRDPDGNGLQSYVSGLATGAFSRTEVYEGILNSEEFRKKQDALYSPIAPKRLRQAHQQ
jgi:hypothetical protein